MTARPPDHALEGMSALEAQTALLAAMRRIEELEMEMSDTRALVEDLPEQLAALRAASVARRLRLQELLGLLSGGDE